MEPTTRRRFVAGTRVVLFAFGGAVIGLLLAGDVRAPIGPFDTTVSARPSWSGSTAIRLAPLGSIELDTHDVPLGLEVRVDELRRSEAERIARDPAVLESLEDDIAADAREALQRVALRGLLVAAIGGAVAAVAARARPRSLLAGGLVGALMAGSLGAATALDFDPGAVAEPSYSGLLTIAPTAVGDVEGVVRRFGEYRAQLSELVGNVVTLYRTAEDLPTFDDDGTTTRLLHVSDVHNNPQAFDLMDVLVEQFAVDAVVDTGDLTDWGSEPESRLLDRIDRFDVPYVWVRGNHDSAATQRSVAGHRNAVVLDGDATTIGGLRLWGVPDERFTPDKARPSGPRVEAEQAADAAPLIARQLARDEPPEVDVALVHDARMARDIVGEVPLILSGHTHEPAERVRSGTRILVEGSTGGAGLRGIEGDDPEPLTASVLYFDRSTGRLEAYDRITVRGIGETGARIERHVVRTTKDDGPTGGR